MASNPETAERPARDSAPDLTSRRVVVVGGGIAGLTAAYYLKKRGASVELIEREPSVGGMVRSSLRDERYIVELGPQAFASSSDAISSLARELSINNLIAGDAGVPSERYAFSKGRIQKVPVGALSYLKSALVPGISKFKALKTRFLSKDEEPSGSLASFVSRRFGSIPPEVLLDPFTSNAWACDCEKIEAQGAAASLGTRMPGLLSFKWGMGTLTARLEEILRGSIRTGLCASAIERNPAGGFCVLMDHGRKALDADAVILATPSHVASQLVGAIDAGMGSKLSEISYVPLAVAHLSFKAADIPTPLEGAGFVVPRSEGSRLLAAVFPSKLFPGRCPSGEEMIACYAGGALDESAVELSDSELIEIATATLNAALGITGKPRFSYVKRWLHAVPQFTMGHASRISEIEKALESAPGLFLTGGYVAGPTMANAILHARGTANRSTAFLKTL